MRAFVALTLPQATREALEAVQQVLNLLRPVDPDQMHLTLAFVDDQPGPVLEELHLALEALRAPAMDLRLTGLDGFGDPLRQVHATLAPSDALATLHHRIARACMTAGIDLPRRRFRPHVTLARAPIQDAALARAVAQASARFPIDWQASEFALFESHLHRHGPHYRVLAQYPLALAPAPARD
jgi:2'-5' RNA ligase